MTNQRNVRNIILGKALAVSGTPAGGVQVEPSNLADGQVVITTTNGKRITSLSGITEFTVVQGQGASKPLIKHNIKTANITSAALKIYDPAVEQVSYIGYIGSGTNSLPSGGVDTTYYGAIVLKGEFETYGAREMKKTFNFNCETSNDKADVANGLALSLHLLVATMADPYYKVELLSSAAGSATGAVADTVIGVKGSKTVTITDTGANATVIAIAAGDFLRIGTAVSAEIYRVVTSTVGTSGGILTLDRPLKADLSLLGTTCYFITSANVTAGYTGIRLTALPKTYADITFRFYKIRFAVELFNMGSTTAVETTAAKEGSGTSESVQWLESFLVGNEGARYTVQPDMPLIRRKNSLNYLGSGSGWNLITLNYFDVNTTNISGGQKLEKSITIGGVTGTNTQFSDGTSGILTILETASTIGDIGTWS